MKKIIISPDELKQELIWKEVPGSRKDYPDHMGEGDAYWSEEALVKINGEVYTIKVQCWDVCANYIGEVRRDEGEIKILNQSGKNVVNNIFTTSGYIINRKPLECFEFAISGYDYGDTLYSLFSKKDKGREKKREGIMVVYMKVYLRP